MYGKVVYKDGDYTKVLRGSLEERDCFFEVTTESGKKYHIGKQFIISIREDGYDES